MNLNVVKTQISWLVAIDDCYKQSILDYIIFIINIMTAITQEDYHVIYFLDKLYSLWNKHIWHHFFDLFFESLVNIRVFRTNTSNMVLEIIFLVWIYSNVWLDIWSSVKQPFVKDKNVLNGTQQLSLLFKLRSSKISLSFYVKTFAPITETKTMTIWTALILNYILIIFLFMLYFCHNILGK